MTTADAADPHAPREFLTHYGTGAVPLMGYVDSLVPRDSLCRPVLRRH